MLLIDCRDRTRLRLIECFGNDVPVPPYGILSHTWLHESDEPTYKDLVEDTSEGKEKAGYDKLRYCAKWARQDGLDYIWVDTCCIDKTNSVQLSEAINSMFDWYRDSTRCYVYLSGVSTPRYWAQARGTRLAWEEAFRTCAWFTRGWTLQELLAPASVDFFSEEGDRIGNKATLEPLISVTSGINVRALRGDPLSGFSINERFRWASGRKTKREEDEAYCLLGILGVRMRPDYGEGRHRALSRLRRKVEKIHTEPALLSHAPTDMSGHRVWRLRVKWVPERWVVTTCKEDGGENRVQAQVLRTSAEEVSNLPENFRRRYRTAEAEVKKHMNSDEWQVVYWEERPNITYLDTVLPYVEMVFSTLLKAPLGLIFHSPLTVSLYELFSSEPLYDFEIEFILKRRGT